VQAAGFDWDAAEAHSAVYDTDRTARLFCAIVNRWQELSALAAPDATLPVARSA
jgi:ribonuclease T